MPRLARHAGRFAGGGSSRVMGAHRGGVVCPVLPNTISMRPHTPPTRSRVARRPGGVSDPVLRPVCPRSRRAAGRSGAGHTPSSRPIGAIADPVQQRFTGPHRRAHPTRVREHSGSVSHVRSLLIVGARVPTPRPSPTAELPTHPTRMGAHPDVHPERMHATTGAPAQHGAFDPPDVISK